MGLDNIPTFTLKHNDTITPSSPMMGAPWIGLGMNQRELPGRLGCGDSIPWGRSVVFHSPQ